MKDTDHAAARAANIINQQIGLTPSEQALVTRIISGEYAPLMAFLTAFDTWAVSPDGAGGPLFDAVVDARNLVPIEMPLPVEPETPGEARQLSDWLND